MPFIFHNKTIPVATNVYQYIADNRPQEAENLISRYGYNVENVQSSDDLAECLAQLVAQEGEQPLYEIADMHPDYHLIIETYQGKLNGGIVSENGCGCGCKSKSATNSYIEAAQNSNSNGIFSINQSGLLLIGGLLIITLALIATKN